MSFETVLAVLSANGPLLAIIITAAWGAIGSAYAYLNARYKLPKAVINIKKFLDKWGADIPTLFVEASALKTDDAKRKYVVKKLQEIAEKNNAELSDATANLLVEYLYTKYKATIGK